MLVGAIWEWCDALWERQLSSKCCFEMSLATLVKLVSLFRVRYCTTEVSDLHHKGT